jgi:hypothetical protein
LPAITEKFNEEFSALNCVADMRGSRLHLLRGFALFLVLAAVTPAAQAQSCALCYTQAASSGARVIKALRSGILVLVIPPAFLSVGITVAAYRKRNQFTNPKSPDSSERSW